MLTFCCPYHRRKLAMARRLAMPRTPEPPPAEDADGQAEDKAT